MSVSIIFARAVVAELQQRGLDTDVLLTRSGITPERMLDIRAVLQLEETERLTRNALELTGDPALGLAVGAAESEGAFQIYGHLLRAQRTAREVFAVHQHYASLIARGPTWNLLEAGDLAYLSLTSYLRDTAHRRFLMEYAMTATMRLNRPFFPRPTRESETYLRAVWFQHEAPRYVDAYRSYFRCPLAFGQASNALIFPRELLDRPQAHADPTVGRLMREAADRLMRDQSGPEQLHQRVRNLLRYCVELQDVSARRVARHFGLTLSTLRRRLASEGHALSVLIDEARQRAACEALMHGEMSLPAVAEMVGFSEPSAFFRAFKRWTGTTPGSYRRLATSGSSLDRGRAS